MEELEKAENNHEKVKLLTRLSCCVLRGVQLKHLGGCSAYVMKFDPNVRHLSGVWRPKC